MATVRKMSACPVSQADVARHYARALDGLSLARLNAQELRARSVLDAGMAALGRDVRERRIELYRKYVGETVVAVTPLLLRYCALGGLDVDDLAGGLGPDRPWVPWLCGARPRNPARRGKGQTSSYRPTRSEAAYHGLQHFAHSGVVLRRHPATSAFGIRVLNERLEFGAYLGRARIRTFGIGGAIRLPDCLPATLAAALPGRTLDALVDHPLLNGAGCVVTAVEEPTLRGVRVLFRLSAQPWTLPWARTSRTTSS